MDNLSEEEKKAIEIVKEIPHNHHEEIFMSEDLAIARVLNIIEKQNKELMLSKLGEIGKQGCLKCKTVENAVNLRRDNIKLKQKIKALKNDTYWKGYIDKQNEAAEICKQCKYIKNNKIKDKMIDLMSEQLAEIKIWDYKKDTDILKVKEEVKEYFRKKVENNESND